MMCIPAFLVLARNVVFASTRFEKCAYGFTVVWSLACLGFAPISSYVHSSIDERVLRCGFANLMMLAMLIISLSNTAQLAEKWAKIDIGGMLRRNKMNDFTSHSEKR